KDKTDKKIDKAIEQKKGKTADKKEPRKKAIGRPGNRSDKGSALTAERTGKKAGDRKELIAKLVKEDIYVPMKEKELAVLLQVKPEDRPVLKNLLDEMVGEGRLVLSKRGKYCAATRTDVTAIDDSGERGNDAEGRGLRRKSSGSKGRGSAADGSRGGSSKTDSSVTVLTGTYISNPRGFGFVEIEGQEEDLFVPEGKSNGAFHKDIVEVELRGAHRKGRRQEARIVRIVTRATSQVVGVFEQSQRFGFVIPDNNKLSSDIFIAAGDNNGAVDGHKVVAEIINYGDGRRSPEGRVIEILGHVNDPGVDILSIVKAFGLPMEFDEKVLKQAERVATEVTDADREGRKDLRSVPMVTIDGADAKDLDDAVGLTLVGENYRLGVHIADVTNYVQEQSALDREAYERGTSVYLVDRVIPMLPHALSNNICSLNVGVDRLALSCIMLISPQGEVIDHELAETVIRVDQRMTYTDVRAILEDNDEELIDRYKEFYPMFRQMETLAAILRQKRKRRGSIDFDFPESKITLDKAGVPLEVNAYESNTATKIIEEFMLLANETVARHFAQKELPFVYRTHDNPDPDKIGQLGIFIQNFGYKFKSGTERLLGKAHDKTDNKAGRKKAASAVMEEIHPMEIQKLLTQIEGTAQEGLITRLTLRSMKRAQYSEECTGHFGLACHYYSHFTSPIRRYPDLQIHRIIKEHLRGRLQESRIDLYAGLLPQVAKQSSLRERRAEEAEREVLKLKKTEYMERHLGEVFSGVISGITSWGIYVELPNTIEGMIHVATLAGDYYQYDEMSYEMVGKDSGRRFQLGQAVTIRVKGADRMTRTIDFTLCEDEEENYGSKGSDEAGSQQ
ncbi:MAG: ribonuclease R, partial [Lachnospiraceae bacterium]|nr:ribonuclease R [Lachnospiraceae bacterium]